MQIIGYDLRGGTSSAMALGSQGHHPAVLEVVLRQALMQLPELEQQTSIVRSAVNSINLDPVDPNRLAFHLASGWSGSADFCYIYFLCTCKHIHTGAAPRVIKFVVGVSHAGAATCSQSNEVNIGQSLLSQ